MQIHEWRTEPWEGFGLTEKSDYNPSNSNPYFYRYSGEHAGLIANAPDRMSARDSVRQAVFGTVAQALMPAAPGLFPALGL